MKLPKRFRAGNIVILKAGHWVMDMGGSIDLPKGHLFRVEEVTFQGSRNGMGDGVNAYLILSTCVGDMPLFFRMEMSVAQDKLEVKPGATVLYGDNNDSTQS